MIPNWKYTAFAFVLGIAFVAYDYLTDLWTWWGLIVFLVTWVLFSLMFSRYAKRTVEVRNPEAFK